MSQQTAPEVKQGPSTPLEAVVATTLIFAPELDNLKKGQILALIERVTKSVEDHLSESAAHDSP